MTAHTKELREYFDRVTLRSTDSTDEQDRQLLWSAIERTIAQAELGAYLTNASAYEVIPKPADGSFIQLACVNGVQREPLMSLSSGVTLAQILDAVRAHEHEYHPVPKEH
jgi:hypothetical protein